MSAEFETIVLGLGAMGSATLYQLSKRGHKVLGIDQFSPPHTLGSSHGDTRITRQAIGEGAHYSPLSLRSYEIFRELEAMSGDVLLETVGGLMISSVEKTSMCFVPEFYETTVAAAKRFGVRHELLDAGAMRKRFPQFNVRDNEFGYYEHEAGFLRPERCIAAQLRLAREQGATIHCNEKVIDIEERDGGVVVKTDRAQYRAGKLVVSAGAWLTILQKQLKDVFNVTRQVLYWFDISDVYELFAPPRMPIFIWEVQDAKHSNYGFPAIDGPNGGMKIGASTYSVVDDVDAVSRTVSEFETDEMYETQVKPFFPEVGRRCVKSSVCLYTSTSDAGFVIDWLPSSRSIIICSPCSGHGFKHSAAIGEAVAQMILDGESRIDLSECSLSKRVRVR